MTDTGCSRSSFQGGLVLLTVLYACLHTTAAHATLTPALLEKATGMAVTNLKGDRGAVRLPSGESLAFSIPASTQFADEGQDWGVCVIRFPGEEMTVEALQKVVFGGPCKDVRSPLVVVWNDEEEAYASPIEDGVKLLRGVSNLSFGSFLGSEKQISMEAAYTTCDAGQSAELRLVRRLVFSFPRLELQAALTTYARLRTPFRITEEQSIVYEVADEKGAPVLAMQRDDNTKEAILTLESDAASRIRPLSRALSDQKMKEEADTETKVVKARLVDWDGNGLGNIPVKYGLFLSEPVSFTLPPIVREGRVLSDANGFFQVPLGHGVNLRTQADGYLERRVSFRPPPYSDLYHTDDFHIPATAEVHEIVLEKRPPYVDVWYTRKKIRQTFSLSGGQHLFPLKFYASAEDNANNPLDVPILGDVLIELSVVEAESAGQDREGQQLQFRILGLDGWEVAPSADSLARGQIHWAPEAGYIGSWSARVTENLPSRIFLRKGGGKRYGYLDGLELVKKGEAASATAHEYELSCGYVVQAKPQGTNSVWFLPEVRAYTYD